MLILSENRIVQLDIIPTTQNQNQKALDLMHLKNQEHTQNYSDGDTHLGEKIDENEERETYFWRNSSSTTAEMSRRGLPMPRRTPSNSIVDAREKTEENDERVK